MNHISNVKVHLKTRIGDVNIVHCNLHCLCGFVFGPFLSVLVSFAEGERVGFLLQLFSCLCMAVIVLCCDVMDLSVVCNSEFPGLIHLFFF